MSKEDYIPEPITDVQPEVPQPASSTLPLFTGPDFLAPRDVERVWAGKDRHYASGTAQPYDRPRALKQLEADGGPSSDSVLARAVTNYGPHGRVIPGLLPPWPIRREQQRPWLVPPTEEVIRHDMDELKALLEEVRVLPDSPEERRQLLAGLRNLATILHRRQSGHVSDIHQAHATIRELPITRLLTDSGEVLEAAEDQGGVLRVIRRIARDTTGVAAMLVGSYGLLDLVSDGMLNNHIDWCGVMLIHMIHHHLL